MGKKNKFKPQQPNPNPAPVSKPKPVAPTPKTAAVAPPRRVYTAWLFAAVLFGLAILINSNTFSHRFVLDDHGIIKNNKITKAPVSWENTKTIFTTPLRKGDFSDLENSLYRPFTKLLFNIEWNMFDGDPTRFHVVNVLLYALIGVIVFFIFYDIMNKRWVVPFLIALLFTVHPIHTEVVANIKSGDEVLSLLGIVGALRCIQLYLKSKKMYYMILAILVYLMGSFSKESTVVAVALVPLFLYYFTGASIRQNVFISGAIGLCSGFFLLCRHSALSGYPKPAPLSALDNYLVLANDNIPIRVASAINTLGLYIKTFFIPHPLSCDYSYSSLQPVSGFGDPYFLLSLLVLLGMFAFAIWKIKQKEKTGFGILWFFISMSITSNVFFLIGTSFGERLFFTPSLGLCIATVYLLSKFFYTYSEDAREGGFMKELARSPILFGIILLTSALYSYKTYARNKDWKKDYDLFARDINYYPNSTHLLFYLGNHLSSNEYAEDKTPEQKRKASQEAIDMLTKSMRIYPALPSDGYNQLGKAYFNMGKYDSAQKYYMKAYSEDTTNAIFINNLGTIFYNTSDQMTNMGNAYLKLGKIDSAEYYFVQGRNRLLQAYPYFMKAHQRDTTETDFINNIGCVYGATQRPDSAIYWFEKGYRIDPLDLTSINFLEITYRAMGKTKEADFYKNKLVEAKAEKARQKE